MKTKNYLSKLKSALAMLAVFASTAFISQDAKAQFTITDFSNYTFYDNTNTSGNDLHYNYDWTRSDTTVYLSGSNMVAVPINNNSRWFQTVAMDLTGNDVISFDHRLTNFGGGGTKTIVVTLIDTGNSTNIITAGTVTYSNASPNNAVTEYIFLNDTGVYYIRFTFTHTGSKGSTPQFQISAFSTSAIPTFLPVNYVSFEANQTGSNVNLKWITATEINNSHFEIQRSKNGEEWLTLGTIDGAGSSDEMNVYQFMDMNPMSGINYYRLKQVDFNGDENYSDLREAIIGGALTEEVSIYPNPAGSFVNINIPADIEIVKTEIRTVDGRVLMNNTYSNTMQASVSIQDLTPGMYYIHIQMGNQMIVKPFVKQ